MTHDQDILRLHVAVHDPGVVHVVYALEDLVHERLLRVLGQRLLLALHDNVVQVMIPVLEHERQRFVAWVHVHVVQMHDIVVVQLAQQLNLAHRGAGQHHVVLSFLVWLDHLDGERHGLAIVAAIACAAAGAATGGGRCVGPARGGRPRRVRGRERVGLEHDAVRALTDLAQDAVSVRQHLLPTDRRAAHVALMLTRIKGSCLGLNCIARYSP